MPRKAAAKLPPPTQGGPRVLDMADARAFAKYAKEITLEATRTKESATLFLIKTGYLTKDGKLAPKYRTRKGE